MNDDIVEWVETSTEVTTSNREVREAIAYTKVTETPNRTVTETLIHTVEIIE